MYLLSIVAHFTYCLNFSEKYSQIMKLIWQALDNPARTWKLLFKTLTLIQFLIKNGNERVVEECRDHLHQIRPLQDYNYYEGTVDKGSGVRDLSKAVVELLASNDAIRSEREKARQLRHKFTGVGSDGRGSYGNDPYRGGVGYAEHGISSDDFNRSRRDSYKDNSYTSRNRDGGAYDSGRRNVSEDNRRGDSEEELDYASKMRNRRETNKTTPFSQSGGSKLKVNIKGTTLTKVGKSNKQETSNVDLLGTAEINLLEGNEVVESKRPFSEVSTVDNVSGFSNSVHIQPQGMFDTSNSVPTVQQGFVTDFMDRGTTPSMSEHFFQHPQSTPMQQALQLETSMTQMQHTSEINSMNKPGSQQMSMQFEAFPRQMQPQLPLHQTPPCVFQTTNSSEDTDFGKFESASVSQITKPVPENKFASFGGLVDLGGLTSKSVEEARKQQTTLTQPPATGNSFTGLDGFSNSYAGNMKMISVPSSMPPRPMIQGGPVMNNQLYGQQRMNQLQVNQVQMQNQSMNMLSGQDTGVLQHNNPVVMNNAQQQYYMMYQSGQSMQQGMSMQQHYSNGGYPKQPGHHF